MASVDIAGRKRLGWRLLIPALGVLVLTAGFGTALVVYLVLKRIHGQTFRDVFYQNRSWLVDEGDQTLSNGQRDINLRGLLITSFTGHFISLSIPMVMSMVAYRLAASWLLYGESRREDEKGHEPTPEQYGLLLNLCSSAGLSSLAMAAQSMLTARKRKPSMSPLVTQAFSILTAIYLLSTAISLVDTWLHAEAVAVIYTSLTSVTSDALGNSSIAYGSNFNSTACELAGGSYCGQTVGGWAEGNQPALLQGFAIAGNKSTQHLVITLNDENWMATIIRPNLAANISYTAQSLGLTAACVGLATACQPSTNSSPFVSPLNCSNLGYEAFNFPPASGNAMMMWKNGAFYEEGGIYPNSSNFNVMILISYSPYGDSADQNDEGVQQQSPNSAVIANEDDQSYQFAANCSFVAYDVVLEGVPSTTGVQTTKLVSKSEASDETTGRLWAGVLYKTILNAIVVNTQALVLATDSGDAALADLSQEIARLTLASIGGFLMPIAPQSAGFQSSKLVSAYPIVPLITFLVLLFLYALLVIILFVWCLSASSTSVNIQSAGGEKPHTVALMQMLQQRLTNPSSLVAGFYNPVGEYGSRPRFNRDEETTSLIGGLYNPIEEHGYAAPHFDRDEETVGKDSLLSLQTSTEDMFNESKATTRLRAGLRTTGVEVPQFGLTRRAQPQGLLYEEFQFTPRV